MRRTRSSLIPGRPLERRVAQFRPSVERLESRDTPTSFHLSSLLSPGGAPVVAVGDFNQDGVLDIASANYGDSVSVCLGRSDGTFGDPAFYVAGTYVNGAAVGDFDGDGKLDLVVSEYEDPTVHLLRGNGDGSFQAPVSYAAGAYLRSLAVADFNGDGRLDVATDSRPDGTVILLLNDGAGGLQAPVVFGVGTGPEGMAVGDFNRDGKPDLAVTDWSSSSAVGV